MNLYFNSACLISERVKYVNFNKGSKGQKKERRVNALELRRYRKNIDTLSEIRSALNTVNPDGNEAVETAMRNLYTIYSKLDKLEREIKSTSGLNFLKKKKLEESLNKMSGDFETDFYETLRLAHDRLKRRYREVRDLLPRIREFNAQYARQLESLAFPDVACIDDNDLKLVHEFAFAFEKIYSQLISSLIKDLKVLLDENKRTLDTYDRHIKIDRGEVPITSSRETIAETRLEDLLDMRETLLVEQKYLDGRKGEVGKALSGNIIINVESLQASAETASRLGIELPIDFIQSLRLIARDASKTSNLTTLLSLEQQYESAKSKLIRLIQDRIINIKHETTSLIAEGGIPTTSEVIPPPPQENLQTDDPNIVLMGYQKMLEWQSSVRIALKEKVSTIISELNAAIKNQDLIEYPNINEVKEFVDNVEEKIEKANISELVKFYLRGTDFLENIRKIVMNEIKNYTEKLNELLASAQGVLDTSTLMKKIPKIDKQDVSLVYLIASLKNLIAAVNSGLDNFKDASKQELMSLIEGFQTIKPAYADIFVPVISHLDTGLHVLDTLNSFQSIRNHLKTVKESGIVKAQDALENLRYRLTVKVRLANTRLLNAGLEIPEKMLEAVNELSNLGITINSMSEAPKIARKMIELYEKNIAGSVISILDSEMGNIINLLQKAELIGVDVKEELKKIEEIRAKSYSDVEAAATAFDELSNITSAPELRQKIVNKARDSWAQLTKAVDLMGNKVDPDIIAKLKGLLDQVPSQLEMKSRSIKPLLDTCLTLANIQDEMLKILKDIHQKEKEDYEAQLRAATTYYSTVQRVYSKHKSDFSEIIFPLNQLEQAEENLLKARMLSELLGTYEEIQALRERWRRKLDEIDDWHKTLRMYLSGFNPRAPPAERDKYIEDAKKRIKETFSRKDISTYLSWALQEIALAMIEGK